MKDHRDKYKQYLKTGKIQCYSSRVLEKGKSKILLVEPWPCTSKDELCMREGKWILENECVNKNVAGAYAKAGGKKEYDKQARKNNYKKNRAKVLEDRATPIKCEHCNNVVSSGNMIRHKKTNKSCLKIQQEANLTQ
jgi:hypothetical protein